MRLWTVHPRYLDSKGLVALWREALLAQKVLAERTKGYKNHPQLVRFREHHDPLGAIATYLAAVHDESGSRGYTFDRSKITRRRTHTRIYETTGQLLYEWEHLKAKLRIRDPALFRRQQGTERPDSHPLFRIVSGDVRSWEKLK